MSKRLTLLRHAKSSWGEPGLNDHDRPLAPRGERDAPVMGKRLTALDIRPTLILTSTAVRARQTANLFAKAIGYPREFVQSERALYLADPDTIMEVVSLQDDDFNDVVVCAHNPGITELACRLSGTHIDNVPTSGLVVFSSDLASWDEVDQSRWNLVEFDYPKKNSIA